MQDSKKIIVVDDDADILEATRLTLQSAGYAVETAATAAEGMEKIRSGGIDLVILDVMMARDTEGFQVAQDLKSDPQFKDIPILMMTSVSAKSGFSFDPQTDGDYLPVEDFVEKPVDPADLLARVEKLLKKK